MDAQVVTRINVIVISGREFRSRYGVNDVGEEMLSGGILLYHVFCGAFLKFTVYAQITDADVALGAREEEDI